jgi:hypothetical protein
MLEIALLVNYPCDTVAIPLQDPFQALNALDSDIRKSQCRENGRIGLNCDVGRQQLWR